MTSFRQFLTLGFLLLGLLVGGPCLFLGAMGLGGTLSDTSPRENFESGIFFLLISASACAPLVLWLLWLLRKG